MYIIQAPLLKLKKKYASLNFSNYRNIYVTILCFKKRKQKYLCACVYNIYIYIYIYTHTIYVFLLNVFLWDFNQNKETGISYISAFDHLTNFWVTQNLILPTVSLERKMSVWESIHVLTYLEQSAPPLPWRRDSFSKSSSSFGFAFSWFSIRSLARDTDDSLSASLISSWIFFFFQTTVWNNYWNIVHNKLEVCCSLPQI